MGAAVSCCCFSCCFFCRFCYSGFFYVLIFVVLILSSTPPIGPTVPPEARLERSSALRARYVVK